MAFPTHNSVQTCVQYIVNVKNNKNDKTEEKLFKG